MNPFQLFNKRVRPSGSCSHKFPYRRTLRPNERFPPCLSFVYTAFLIFSRSASPSPQTPLRSEPSNRSPPPLYLVSPPYSFSFSVTQTPVPPEPPAPSPPEKLLHKNLLFSHSAPEANPDLVCASRIIPFPSLSRAIRGETFLILSFAFFGSPSSSPVS